MKLVFLITTLFVVAAFVRANDSLSSEEQSTTKRGGIFIRSTPDSGDTRDGQPCVIIVGKTEPGMCIETTCVTAGQREEENEDCKNNPQKRCMLARRGPENGVCDNGVCVGNQGGRDEFHPSCSN
ncbi:hypothetical protein DdX_02639 [Ditylenchus destructor]|uniref:Secreted protein n=1 Tax=Ditylenchus destructor TaxID=166010 RepID=A0AAD4NBL1_9BILA|nr:hypothetical protein DdX_02639 [Ditylenchus destructor]